MEIPQVISGEDVPPPALARRNTNIWQMDESQKKKVISAYMASVKFMDQQVGRLLDALDRLEMRDNTIVVFISDHGYNLGEHDCWSKLSLWEGSVRIPMIISHPFGKNQHGTTYEGITELIDLYPTLAGLCEMDTLQPRILQGESLSELIVNGSRPGADRIAYTITKGGGAASIRSFRWRYNRWGEDAVPGMEELYDHLNDPEENHNLADQEEYREALIQMREKFEETRQRARSGLSMIGS